MRDVSKRNIQCKWPPLWLKKGGGFNAAFGYPGEGFEYRLMSANVTAWNSFTRSHDSGEFPEADLICFQEHKLSKKEAEMPIAKAW